MGAKAVVQYDFEDVGKVISYDTKTHRGIIRSPTCGNVLYHGRTAEKSGLTRQQLTPGTSVSFKAVNRDKDLPKAKRIALL